VKKSNADLNNLQTTQTNKHKAIGLYVSQKVEGALDEEPFYERLRRRDNE
jgi:hypothetical protein